MPSLLIATTRAGKVQEIKQVLEKLPLKILTLQDFQSLKPPRESGKSYQENALIKVQYYSSQFNLPALCDDTGLEVKALNWRPGIKSHRFAKNQNARIKKILTLLKDTPRSQRTARFISVVAFHNPQTKLLETARAVCPGTITSKPIGIKGFGYDPIFIPQGSQKTYAQISLAQKNRFHSRAQAVKKLLKYFKQL